MSSRLLNGILGAILLTAVAAASLSAQATDPQVKTYIEQVDRGESDAVRKVLPDLVAKYQNNPGIMYLQGRLATDGIEAVKFYQSVVDNFPKSEWADDALYRIYQYYYSLGLYKTADLKMQQLRKEYPASPYVTGKTVAHLPLEEDEPVKLPAKEPPPDTQQVPKAAVAAPAPEPYTLQVGAFSTASNAAKQKGFFEDLGYNVEITNKIRAGRSLYLVWVGSFKNVDEARAFGKEVKTKYKMDSIIVERY